MRSFRHQRLFSWIAILAILLNTFMPLVAQAVDLTLVKQGASQVQLSQDGSSWQELCSASGSVWIKTAADGTVLERTTTKPAQVPGQIHLEHCAYCLTHTASFGLIPSVGRNDFSLSFLSDSRPSLNLPLTTDAAWFAPAARAPPAFFSI